MTLTASQMGKRSAKRRFKGKSKQEKSAHMRNVALIRHGKLDKLPQ
jgi:hypothetical protein